MSMFVLIITIIISVGAGAELQTDKDMLEVAPEIQDGCPPLESAEYQVTVMSSVSLVINGCAYINYNSSNVKRQSYSLWFDDAQHGGQCSRDQGVEHLSFYCLTKPSMQPEITNKGRMYLRLYDETSNITAKPYQKCALYETVNGDDTTFKIAISGHASCDGLLHMLSRPLLQIIPEFNKGSILLLFNKTKLDVSTTSPSVDMTTTESIESIAQRYENRRYILQNFGNRPNPFRKTRRSVVQDSNKSVGSTKTTAIKDKNKSRPLSMEFMQQLLQIQFRHRRSLNTTINSYSDITGYSWIQG